jgi:cytoskeletal protein CcmA (bactofilin family)
MSNTDPSLDLTAAQFRALDERRKRAWIGTDISVKGDLSCTRDLTIDGQVDGTIEVGDNVLTIGEGATVKANLVARAVTISGAVTGNVTARERVDLKATGSVTGDIETPRFGMAEGSVVRGSVEVG